MYYSFTKHTCEVIVQGFPPCFLSWVVFVLLGYLPTLDILIWITLLEFCIFNQPWITDWIPKHYIEFISKYILDDIVNDIF